MVSGQLHIRERLLGGYWNGGWVGLRADLDSGRRDKLDVPPGNVAPAAHSVPCCYTDLTIPVPFRPYVRN
jgi:hypothetical protein